MAFAHHEARPEHMRVRPLLETLADRFGETAHYAVLDGREVVYRAKADPPTGTVRLTSTVGGRNPAHATGVGKALLAHELGTLDAVRQWIGEAPLERRTPRTLCTAEELHRELRATRERGTPSTTRRTRPASTASRCPCTAPRRRFPPGR